MIWTRMVGVPWPVKYWSLSPHNCELTTAKLSYNSLSLSLPLPLPLLSPLSLSLSLSLFVISAYPHVSDLARFRYD